MINQFMERIRRFAKEGLFHIFGSRVIAKVGGLISSMVVVRALEKVEYGYYVSANNLYAYPAIFVGMGMTSVVMQFCSENVSDQRKESIYRHAFFTGNAANILVALTVVGLAVWKYLTGSPQIAMYLLMLSVFPFFEYGESYHQSVLRVKLKNKVFSYSNVANSVVLLLGNIFLTKLFHVPGLIYSRYLAMTVCILFCAAALQKERFYGTVIRKEERLAPDDRRQLNNFAFICAITNFASIVLTLLDITCLDLVLGDPTVLADY
ncbi:MAG: oligosaccharide flippase family protein, partial [Firmicutes bacterium]|nr:oligosaccharide flippase family protein [Bacillota bacterium]